MPLSFWVLEMEKNKPTILVICDYYLPGYKSGGGMRTIVNIVGLLKEKFDFRIITRDHDGKLDKAVYTTVKINEWNDFQGSEVFYLPKNSFKLPSILKLIRQVKPEKIYTNSFFSSLALRVLVLRKLHLISDIDLIVAPCGELSAGALGLKSLKKKIFISAAKALNLYRNVIWKASTETEAEEIRNIDGKAETVLVAPDLLLQTILVDYEPSAKPEKVEGEARLVFVSRFARKKNFKWLLEFLHAVKGNLSIDVYGPLEDADYWRECLEIIKTLPENIKITSRGSIKHEDVGKVLVNYHFFILPTLSENFGHVCLEALAAGCPLIISDKTPWLDLEEKNIGWDLSLDNRAGWIEKLNRCVNMNEAEFRHLSASSRRFAEQWIMDEKIIEATEKVLKHKSKKD